MHRMRRKTQRTTATACIRYTTTATTTCTAITIKRGL
jgi:hypothetical protein